jgi:hypothetical protein
MIELLTAIALLCGTPAYYRTSEAEVLSCQKYYLKCVDKKKKRIPMYYRLTECVLEKKKLGGDK